MITVATWVISAIAAIVFVGVLARVVSRNYFDEKRRHLEQLMQSGEEVPPDIPAVSRKKFN